MVIAFDTFFLTKRLRNVGIYEYTSNLFREFRKIVARNNGIAIRYFACPGYSDDVVMEPPAEGCEAVNSNLLRFHRLWRLGLVSLEAKRIHADLIFSPSPTILPLGLLPVAVTMHDAMGEKLPRKLLGPWSSSVLHRAVWYGCAKLSQRIITCSECSKRDLVEVYNLSPEKVAVAYLSHDQNVFNTLPVEAKTQSSVLAKFGIRRPYILHHGMVQARKNVGRLIQAYQVMRSQRPGLDLQLVLAGPSGWGSESIRGMANGGGSDGQIIFTGALSKEDLAVLVKGAYLCVIPSLYEGFCLPMVEAMACGVATITANNSCMPEISGGVLRYFDALSVDDITAAMRDVLEDNGLRDQLALRGLQRAAEFSWERCAQETLSAIAGVRQGDLQPVCCSA